VVVVGCSARVSPFASLIGLECRSDLSSPRGAGKGKLSCTQQNIMQNRNRDNRLPLLAVAGAVIVLFFFIHRSTSGRGMNKFRATIRADEEPIPLTGHPLSVFSEKAIAWQNEMINVINDAYPDTCVATKLKKVLWIALRQDFSNPELTLIRVEYVTEHQTTFELQHMQVVFRVLTEDPTRAREELPVFTRKSGAPKCKVPHPLYVMACDCKF